MVWCNRCGCSATCSSASRRYEEALPCLAGGRAVVRAARRPRWQRPKCGLRVAPILERADRRTKPREAWSCRTGASARARRLQERARGTRGPRASAAQRRQRATSAMAAFESALALRGHDRRRVRARRQSATCSASSSGSAADTPRRCDTTRRRSPWFAARQPRTGRADPEQPRGDVDKAGPARRGANGARREPRAQPCERRAAARGARAGRLGQVSLERGRSRTARPSTSSSLALVGAPSAIDAVRGGCTAAWQNPQPRSATRRRASKPMRAAAAAARRSGRRRPVGGLRRTLRVSTRPIGRTIHAPLHHRALRSGPDA